MNGSWLEFFALLKSPVLIYFFYKQHFRYIIVYAGSRSHICCIALESSGKDMVQQCDGVTIFYMFLDLSGLFGRMVLHL